MKTRNNSLFSLHVHSQLYASNSLEDKETTIFFTFFSRTLVIILCEQLNDPLEVRPVERLYLPAHAHQRVNDAGTVMGLAESLSPLECFMKCDVLDVGYLGVLPVREYLPEGDAVAPDVRFVGELLGDDCFDGVPEIYKCIINNNCTLIKF